MFHHTLFGVNNVLQPTVLVHQHEPVKAMSVSLYISMSQMNKESSLLTPSNNVILCLHPDVEDSSKTLSTAAAAALSNCNLFSLSSTQERDWARQYRTYAHGPSEPR